MGREDFERVMAAKESRAVASDWLERRDAWIARVRTLHNTVKGYLSRYVDAGQVEITEGEKQVTEEFIGSYVAPVLEIDFRGTRVKLDPIGAMIIGVSGRVDMVSSGGTATLVVVPHASTRPHVEVSIADAGEGKPPKEQRGEPNEPQGEVPLVWKVVARVPSVRYLELTEDLFFDTIVELIGGETSF